MSYSKQKLLGFVIETFAKDMLLSFEQLKSNYKKINIDITGFIPSPFNDLSTMVVSSFYYSNKDRVEINFVKGKKGSFHYNVIEENIWRENLFDNDTGVVNELYSLAEPLPKLEPPYLNVYGYGMFYSFDEFVRIKEKTLDIVHFMISSTLDIKRNMELEVSPQKRIKHLESLALEFHMKIENPLTTELELDGFLDKNKEILEFTLELDKIISQPTLEDVLGKYNQNLKPDAIAFDAKNNKWVIVDYKRADKELLKNVGKVRTSFRSDVYNLQGQLKDYVEYFQEQEHRKSFKEKYKYNIFYPSAIGIIGKLNPDDAKDLNRIMHDLPNWFSLYPYNYILNSFVNYINKMKKIMLY